MSRVYTGAPGRINYPVARPQYWAPSMSEVDCSASGRYPPDSAYYTKSPATQSILSGEFLTSSQQSLTGAMNAMELPHEQMPYMFFPAERLSRGSLEVQTSLAEQQTEPVSEWVCHTCVPSTTFKNKSEYK